MYSIIITAYKEASTIVEALKYLADPQYSEYKEFLQIIQVSPDKETLNAAKEYIKNLNNKKVGFLQLVDDNIGKPHALNQALKKVTGENVILTDGDVHLEQGSLRKLIENYEKTGADAACGNPKSANSRRSFMGFVSHLMVSAADHKRRIELLKVKSGFGTKFVKKVGFFPLSGYILIFNKSKLEESLGEGFVFPGDCLVEDAYLSYVIYNYNLNITYIPEATVLVKFPTHLKDYIAQKKRSTGGYVQLWKYGVVNTKTKTRSFWHDLAYFWFPFKFIRNPIELIYVLMYYPVRLYLWLLIWWDRKVKNKNFKESWVRIESTK